MLDIETRSLSVICPVLKRKEIEVKQWEQVTDELMKAEENIKELSVPAENLFNITSRVIKDSGMFMVKPEITSNPQLFNDFAVQQHIHIGDKIGTQVKDSFVQRSTIGAGAQKCPECGRWKSMRTRSSVWTAGRGYEKKM